MPLNQSLTPRGSETVLLVDTDPETRKLAAFMLAKQGYTVLEARNRADALTMFEQPGGKFDLALVELRGRGKDLADTLKQIQPDLTVLFMSENRPNVPALERGSALLSKPFTMSQLAGKVREVLDAVRPRVMTAGGRI